MPKSKTDWSEVQRETSAKAHREQVAAKEKLLKGFAARLAAVEKERDIALELRSHRLRAPAIVAVNDEDSEATAFAVTGDWHVEETVDPKTVNGLNEYSLEIAEARIAKLFRTVIRLTEIERAGTTIENLVFIMLGDMMTGYIHEELQESNGLSPTKTVLWLRERIVAGLRLLIKEGGFKKIIVPCCYGNHGRTTKKPRHATGASNSYEWMMYNLLATDVPEVEWRIADGYHLLLEVYGKIVRIHHGDNVAYNGGIGGLTIPLEKAIASWNKARVADLDIHGHWHTQMQSPKTCSNGSLIGHNAYSLAIKAAFEPPQQTFFLFDSKRGRTATWPIILT